VFGSLVLRRLPLISAALVLALMSCSLGKSASQMPASFRAPEPGSLTTVGAVRASVPMDSTMLVFVNEATRWRSLLDSLPADEVVSLEWVDLADCRAGGTRPCMAAAVTFCGGAPTSLRSAARHAAAGCPWRLPSSVRDR
jgi:hypothetical protein